MIKMTKGFTNQIRVYFKGKFNEKQFRILIEAFLPNLWHFGDV
jgi:hypothetical protein